MTTIEKLCTRLEALSEAVTKGRDAVNREFYMSIPAQPGHDADLVLCEAAATLRALHSHIESETECPAPAEWDQKAFDIAQRLWRLPEMPRSQLISTIQNSILEAMQWSQPRNSDLKTATCGECQNTFTGSLVDISKLEHCNRCGNLWFRVAEAANG